MVTRTLLALAVTTGLSAGCGIKVNGGLDPTLHFHHSLKQLKQPPVPARIGPAKQFSTRVVIEPVAPYYPLPLGLRYDSGGASRKLRSQFTGASTRRGRPEQALTQTLRRVLRPGSGEIVVLTTALVALELYKLGGNLYSAAALEARVVRRGHEVYTARYYARANTIGRSGGLAVTWPSLEHQLVGQLQQDRRLIAALEGSR